MGKTYTASLLANHYDNIIILAPLRYLAQQLLINMSNYLDHKYNPILISMDGSRDIDKIKSYIGNKNIFSCTYDSADIMVQLIDELNNTYLIIDEFHNLTNSSNIDQIINKIDKHLYLSATPPKDFTCDYKYEYSWQDAIKNKYICDFDIVIHENNQDLYKFSYLLKQLCSDKNNVRLMAKAYFIVKGMMYFGNRKCICYMTTIEKANEMYNILYWMGKLLNVEIDSWIITCNTAKTKRANYLYNFKKSNKLSIMINVHILDEGIDIPECDSVFITQPNNNIINIVQRLCRANRITEYKTQCQIFLWCNKNKTAKILEYLSDNTNGIIDSKVIKLNIKYNCTNKIKHIINSENKNTTNITILDYLKNTDNNSIENIDNEFIKKYCTFYEICEKTKYGIDVDLVIKYFGYRDIKKFYERLRENYKINIDYITNRISNPGSKSAKRVQYLLSFDCFEKICMLSRTEKGDFVRNNYINMRKIMMDYQNYKLEIITQNTINLS